MDAKLSQQPYLAWQDWRWDHPEPGSACGHRVTHSHPGSPLPTGVACSLSGTLQPIHTVPRVAASLGLAQRPLQEEAIPPSPIPAAHSLPALTQPAFLHLSCHL